MSCQGGRIVQARTRPHHSGSSRHDELPAWPKFQTRDRAFQAYSALGDYPRATQFPSMRSRTSAAGGRLVFDVFNPNLTLLACPINPDEIEDTPELTLPDGRRLRRSVRMLQKRYADQCTDCELIYYLEGRRIVQCLTMRHFFRFELEHLLARSGFEVTALYGEFDATPFADNSPEMIFIAARQ
jgi:hypothetical protein